MKANHTTVVLPILKPCQLPLGGKWLSNNAATRMFLRCAMMAGMSSTRSWVAVICLLIPRAYLNSRFPGTIRTNCEYIAFTMCGLSKIDRTHVAIGADFFGSTFCEYRAADQNRDLLGKTKYQIHVMIDDQDADGFWQR